MSSTSSKTLILDNGAYNIKAGYSTDKTYKLISNSIIKSKADRKRVYIGDEINECYDKSALYYVLPFERGYLVNWDVELQIFDRVFGKNVLNVDFQDTRLLLTDPSDISKAIRDVSAEIVFESYQFDSFLKTSASSCVAYKTLNDNYDNPEAACSLIIDSGHSFTHIVPFIDGKIIRNGIVRVDVGGKILTNQLKEWISYRQLNVLEETYVMNQCKEDSCFVSTNFQQDMDKCLDNSLRRYYIFPDFVNLHRGVLQTNTEVDDHVKISLSVERFCLPEILFQPNNIDINQMGIVEAINYSLQNLTEELRYLILNNIILIGGNTLFSGYKQRIEQDLRPYITDYFKFKIYQPHDPIGYAWKCASELLNGTGLVCEEFNSKFVTRSEYNENGSNICRDRFLNYF